MLANVGREPDDAGATTPIMASLYDGGLGITERHSRAMPGFPGIRPAAGLRESDCCAQHSSQPR